MNIKIAGLVLLLTGCNGEIYYHYENRCFHNISSEIPLDKDAFRHNLVLAETLLTSFLKEDICQEFGELPIYVLDKGSWGEPRIIGLATTIPREIFINKYMGSLAHELLHIYDFNRGNVIGSCAHTDWDTNGYTDLDNKYWFNSEDPLIPTDK